MNLPCDPSTLFILQRHHSVRKSSQSGCSAFNHSFQFNRILPNGLFEHLAVVDIGTGAIPPEDLAVRISNRYCTRAKPAIMRVRASKTIVALVALARLYAMHPSRKTLFFVVWMYIFQPSLPNSRFR